VGHFHSLATLLSFITRVLVEAETGAKRRREMQPARRSLSTNTVRQAVAHTVAACVRLLHEWTILVLLLLFCLDMRCMLWYVARLQSNLIASTAVQDASLYA
jgi:hypothetical protein